MARFRLTTRTVDSDGNQSSETLSLKAGPSFTGIPQVSYVFPGSVAVKNGGTGGPIWASGTYQGFSFCEVTPTPSTNGTGAFYVQHYYDSGNFPNDPQRRFIDTFRGTGSTLTANWAFNTSQLFLTDGGVSTSGFAVSTDLEDLRQAIILSNSDQGLSTPGDDGISRLEPSRFGNRTPDTDGIIAAYNHDLTNDKLQTIEIIQKGKVETDGADKTNWTSGTFAFFHPYHYVPVYQNNSVAIINRKPYILTIEDGVQYPLNGIFTVSGTSVTGQYSQLDTQISGQSVIRFEGDTTWYIVSGALSSSGLIIYDYGDNPSFTNVGAEINRYALGSGVIKVLPNLAGCDLWDVNITPEYNDGDSIPNTTVTYTANLTGTGAPSGTIQYDWTVLTDVNGAITSSGATNAGSTLDVTYANSGVRKNVQVAVSGSGQPACVHEDETGFLSLKLSADAGIWSQYSVGIRETYDTGGTRNIYNQMKWQRRSTPDADIWFHHWVAEAKPLSATPPESYTFASTLNVEKDELTDWPSTGTFVLEWRTTSSSDFHFFYGTYTGKSSSLSNADQLQGITWRKYLKRDSDTGKITDHANGTGTRTALSGGVKRLSLQSVHHFPMTYITGSSSSKTITAEDIRRVVDVRLGTNSELWLIKPQDYPYINRSVHDSFVSVVMEGNNTSSNQITFEEFIDSKFREEGNFAVVAPWYHWRNDPNNTEDLADPKYWNTLNSSLFIVLGDDVGFGINWAFKINATADMEVSEGETFEMYIYDPIRSTVNRVDWFNVTSASNLTFTYLPYRGRIILPTYSRGNIVIEYGGWESKLLSNEGNQSIKLTGCKVIASETTATKNSSNKYQIPICNVAFTHKQLKIDPSWSIVDAPGTDSSLSINNSGNKDYSLGRAGSAINVIQANYSETDSVGTVASALNPPIWETIIDGFPTGGIPQVDPIYLQDPSPAAGGGGGGGSGGGSEVGCVHEDSYVITQRDDIEQYIPIKDINVNDCVLTSKGYKRILAKMAYEHVERLKIVLEDGSLLYVTDQHPIAVYMKDHFEFIEAGDLIIDDLIVSTYSPKGSRIAIIEPQETIPMYYYDLELESPNDFYANNILVHNKTFTLDEDVNP